MADEGDSNFGRPQEQSAPSRTVRPPTDWLEGLLAVGFLVLLALAALAVLAFSKPVTVKSPTTLTYKQGGVFSYSAAATPGAAYPEGRATTGDPLFLRLVGVVAFRFSYRFIAPSVHRISGTASLTAVLSSSSGWRRRIVLQPPTPFSGDRTVASGRLAVRTLPALIAKVEKVTAVSGQYTLTISPEIRAHGRISGAAVQTSFTAPLTFTLSSSELQPLLTVPADSPSTSGGSVLQPSRAGSLTAAHRVANTVSFKIAKISVRTARDVTVPGIVATFLSLLACGLLFRRGRPADEATGIRSRYRDWMIPVSRVRQPPELQLVEVGDMNALAAIAERYDRMILHEQGEDADTFSVADDGVLYRYTVPRGAQPEERADEPAAPTEPPDNVTPIKRKSA